MSEVELFFSSLHNDFCSIPLPKSALKLSLDSLIHAGSKFGNAVILKGNEIEVVGKWRDVVV